MTALLPADIVVGHVYEAKHPKAHGNLFAPLLGDRQVKWISALRTQVQYDSPSVKDGRHYPTVSMEAFLKWAARDVTAEMPPGEWRSAS